MEERFIRNIPSITEEEQEKLCAGRVCVVGCGGLGGYIVEMLARVGVGHITVADGDSFEESNLNRQLLAVRDTIGKPKAETARQRVLNICPGTDVRVIPEYINEANIYDYLRGHDIIMDALDSAETRKLLAKACRKLNIPLIHGAIRGWNAQIAVCMPDKDIIGTLYAGKTESGDKSCLGFTPALCASLECAEAVKLLTGREATLKSRILLADLRSMEFETVEM